MDDSVGKEPWVGEQRATAPDVDELRELRESEARFRQIAEALPQFIWVMRPDGTPEYLNDRWREYSGQETGSGASSEQLAEAVHPDDRGGIVARWYEAMGRGQAFESEARLRRHDGAYRWFLVRTVPLHNEKGEITRWFGSSTDIHQQKRSAETARFLAELAEVIRLVEDPEALLWQAVKMTGEYVQATRCFFAEVDQETGVWRLYRDFRASEDLYSIAGQYPLSDAPPAMIDGLRAGRVVDVADTERDAITAAFHKLIYEPLGVRSVMAIPLLREGRWASTFSLFYEQAHAWTAEETALLETVAERTWNAVERARAEQGLRRLNETLEQRVAERTAALVHSEKLLRQMASTLTMAEQEERRRISQVLHDDLQQQLYGIQMKLTMTRDEIAGGETTTGLKSIDEIDDWLAHSVQITRQLTVDLSPPILKSEGLLDMLAWLTPQLEALHGLKVRVEAEHAFPVADSAMRILLFQIVRELLFNVVKHAGTQAATVSLREEGERQLIEISDSGCGFDPAEVATLPHSQTGFGLFSARERLRLFGGDMTLESAPGAGTRIVLIVPRNASQDQSK